MAIFSAKLVIGIYEKQYPNDDRPRKAIEAAVRYQKNPTEKNRLAANVTYANNAANAAAYATTIKKIKQFFVKQVKSLREIKS